MDSMLNKHYCFKYCFCEGRTGNGIETINAYSSFLYLLPVYLILSNKTFKQNQNTYWLCFMLVCLAISSFYFHYYMHILGSHCDNFSTLLILLSFICYKIPIFYTILVYITIIIILLYLKESNVFLTILVIIYFIYYFFTLAKKYNKFNKLFYQINILFIIAIGVWLHDFNLDYICLHWLWHLITAIIFYLLYIWFRTIYN